MSEYRTEKDTMGMVQVPSDKLWGAQTQRSFENFKIGGQRMPLEAVYALAYVKKAAAYANCELGVLSAEKRDAIAACCDEIVAGQLDEHFPLCVWQTGSGTQTNMNVNEVIVNRAEQRMKGEIVVTNRLLSANDDVNKSQSTNDVFPTAMRIAAAKLLLEKTIPSLENLAKTYQRKIDEFGDIKKIGRTHLMDATPLTLGEELSGHQSQIVHGIECLKNAMKHLMELPVGGTAVGNGLNTPEGYDRLALSYINQFTGLQFVNAPNKFEAMASHDSVVEVSGALKRLAVSLMKIANDIRLLSSGPRCGIGELTIPANEPGSSIMPGKVNPTQCEALTMVCCQVIGNDAAMTAGGFQGHLELNVFMPLMVTNILHSARILADAVDSFNRHCLMGMKPNLEKIDFYLKNSLMLVTKLSPTIGYYNAAKIAQHAFEQNMTLKESAMDLQLLSEEEFDKIMKL
ncbi:MAG: class II fumarate hydratase [Bacteroidales bacterium]|nr:class II fumarate hydratase [Bacteroidales bacterium]